MRDRVFHNSAGFRPLFEHDRLDAGSRKEEGRRKSGRPRADHGCLLAGSLWCRALRLAHVGVVGAFRRLQLHLTDVQSLLVVIAHAPVRAGMRTERSCDEWKGVLLDNDPESIVRAAFLHCLKICRNILMDWAGRCAGREEAVHQRQTFLHLHRRQWLHGLVVTPALKRPLLQLCDSGDIDLRERLARNIREHLVEL